MNRFTTLCLLFISCYISVTHATSLFCDPNTGMSDSNVLALSSQPGFCQTYGYEAGKAECRHLSKNSYQSHHLTLHGLWPNQSSCGQSYGYCGVQAQNNHCNYSPLALTPEVASNLKKFMPGYNSGSCLERHEWNKHGSCQILATDNYFSLAMRLLVEADQSEFGNYLREHHGKTVLLKDLEQKISQSFGANNEDKVFLGCKNGILVDIHIQLPALIPFSESLESLIDRAPSHKHRHSCFKSVKISDFSSEEN